MARTIDRAVRYVPSNQSNGRAARFRSSWPTYRASSRCGLSSSARATEYGRLDGVIHAAGIGAGGVIQIKTHEIAERVLAPKVAGALALARALEGVPLDFFVLCSSIDGVPSEAGGQADYCAANVYLDAFAAYHARRTGARCRSTGHVASRSGMAADRPCPRYRSAPAPPT